jgi:hypothetical protein
MDAVDNWALAVPARRLIKQIVSRVNGRRHAGVGMLLNFVTQFSLKVLQALSPIAPLWRVPEIASVNVYLNAQWREGSPTKSTVVKDFFKWEPGARSCRRFTSFVMKHLKQVIRYS